MSSASMRPPTGNGPGDLSAAPEPQQLAERFTSLMPDGRIQLREGYAEVGDDIRLHYVEAGDGPLVVLLHGLPEFCKSADDYLKVHSVGASEADVTEGSGDVWERLHYDWSNPNRVVLKTTDSNTWGGASGYTYTFKPLPQGKTEVDVDIVREGKNVKGKTLALVLGTVGKGVLAKAFDHSITAIEAHSNGVPAR